MNAANAAAPMLRKLYDLPLGSRFRYVGQPLSTYVLLYVADGGLVGDAPSGDGNRVFQGLYSAAESRAEFLDLVVEFVPVVEDRGIAASGTAPNRIESACLGDIEKRSTGDWRDVDLPGHGGAAQVVWRMEHDERSPVCEEQARRLVASWNACDGIPTKRLEDLGRPLMEHLFGADQHAAELVAKQRELMTERTVLLEFTRATLELSSTMGHPEATAEDERKAEARYDAALPAARALISFAPPAPCALPAEAIALGTTLDSESLDQGEPA